MNRISINLNAKKITDINFIDLKRESYGFYIKSQVKNRI